MQRRSFELSLMIALSACAGMAPDGQIVDRYPVAIASDHESRLVEMAQRLFPQLPEEHRARIARAGGIGSRGFDPAAFDLGATDVPSLPEVDPDITANEYLGLLVSDELAERLTGAQWNILHAIADTLDQGKRVPHMCFAPDTDRDYAYAVNQLIEFPFQVRFQQITRWTSTATDGGGLGQGQPTTLTYSFVPDGTHVPDLGIGLGSGDSTLFDWLDGVYGDTATWQALFAQIFDRWSQLINVTYVYEPNDDGADLNGPGGQLGVRGDIRISAFNYQNDGNGGVLAYNNFPNDGDMAIDAYDTFYNNTAGNSLRLRNVLAHEHGHGLGMLHVCPAVGTKLMEPFISTAYDGPQLDDILNGIRHYGDVYEPNDSTAQVTDLGTLGIGQSATIENIGIDDNSDSDYFHVAVNERARITFAVGPDAGQYVQGPQDSSCSGGSLTNYNVVQDLRITAVDAGGNFLAGVNDTGFGEGEMMLFDTEVGGDFYFVVNGATSVNNVQRYLASALVTEIPFLTPLIEGDIPGTVDPGVPTSFGVTIDPREDVVAPGSAELLVSVNGAGYSAIPLTSNGGDSYTATLPAFACGDSVLFYLAVEGETGGVVTLPEDGSADPFRALVGDITVAFEDSFETDMGWSVTGVVGRARGRWERGVPMGDGSRGDAPSDADGSGSCYLTGNGNPGSDTDVDNGQTVLASPLLDLSGDPEAVLSYSRWYDNTGSGTGAAPGADVFTVEISNNAGISWTTLEVVGPDTAESSGGWFDASMRVADFVTPTNAVVVRFIAEDAGEGSVIEAAVDGVRISGLSCEEPATCIADITGDGQLNFFDVSAFLVAFSGGDLSVDFTGDGNLNFFDVSAFLTVFSGGCP